MISLMMFSELMLSLLMLVLVLMVLILRIFVILWDRMLSVLVGMFWVVMRGVFEVEWIGLGLIGLLCGLIVGFVV